MESWISRPPRTNNIRTNPGLRHYSRLYTKPKPFLAPKDPNPDAQLKFVYNYYEINSQGSMLLADAKNIFSRQLPNMGNIYISRLVFDVKAFTVIILHEGRTHGGICARIFEKEGFIEIAFCAVDFELQGRGYGRILMNYLKSQIQSINIYDIITCADNEAVTYFLKQGFNKHEILINPQRWVGCIKDYDGITLVHCKLRPDIVYPKFYAALRKQTDLVQNKTGVVFSQTMKKFIPRFQPFPNAPSFDNVSIPEILSTYGVNSGGKTKLLRKKYIDNYDSRMKDLKKRILKIFNTLSNDRKFSEVFEEPVTEDIAPGYFTKIKKPMDFFTIRKRLMKYPDFYKRPDIFATDIILMCDNCKLYNAPDTSYYKLANDLMKRFSQLYNEEFPECPLLINNE
ncbi:acetyltransferase, GNAT family protein [Histomonas meleagridis]|uniref:acetyltransferase, GNAT family protein n=1 Tax=Histomonas meleagridis TaxID=135588 RepID=UPI0035596492|nr:acetyltransferase, GNAT family protein [Histomonas meleagridis]KAH0797298.1 acetyltransferase, GNAT family protein [Histomonas meleagridis]